MNNVKVTLGVLCLAFSFILHLQVTDSINFYIQNYQYVKALEVLNAEKEISNILIRGNNISIQLTQ